MFLRRVRHGVRLSAEQRAGAGIDSLLLALHVGEGGPALAVDEDRRQDEDEASRDSVVDRVLAALEGAVVPMTSRQLRARCKVRMATLLTTLGELTASGQLQRSDCGWRLGVSPDAAPQGRRGNRDGKPREAEVCGRPTAALELFTGVSP